MTRDLGRTVATALLAALVGAAWAAVFYAWKPALRFEFDRDVPRGVSGIYPVERDRQTRLTFAWTRDEVTIRLPGLDRRVPWTLAMRVRGARPSGNPSVQVLADGVPCGNVQTQSEFQDVHIDIPARPERLRDATVTLRVSSTMVPGPSDPRALGVMLDRLSVTPAAVVLAPHRALEGAAVASAIFGAAIAVTGVTAGSAIGGAALVGAGAASIVTRGYAPYTAFPLTAAWIGLWIGLALAAGVSTSASMIGHPLRNTARFAAILAAATLFLRLLVLLHPNMPVGDAMFHAHRYQGVLGGVLLFTSVAPGGYAFPYAPGLYVFAELFAPFVHHGPADMALLRIVTASADAIAALVLYRVVVQAWNDRLAAAMAVALYVLTPLDFAVMITGNLTNAFAQSLSVGALALMATRWVRLENAASVTVLALLLAAAYLSHTSTLAILFLSTIAIAGMFLLRGGPALRSAASAILIATLVAGALATVLYYAHFMDTYRTEFARIGHETATNAADAGGRTIGARAAGVPYYLRLFFGVPLLALAFIGAWWQYARAAADRLSLTTAGWLIACTAFLLVGVLTPVDMRYYLAAIPAVAILAARGAARAWERRGAWRLAAMAALAWIVVTGIHTWWDTLG